MLWELTARAGNLAALPELARTVARCVCRALNSVEVFDPQRNVWRAAPSMPTGRRDHMCIVLHGKLVVYGGKANNG